MTYARTPDCEDQFRKLWEAGASVTQIRNTMKMGKTVLNRWRIDLGLTERHPGAEAWPQARMEKVKSLWLEGKSAAQIAAALNDGASRNAVISKLQRMGLTLRAQQSGTLGASNLKAPPVKRDRQPGAVNARKGRPKPEAQSPFGASDPVEASAKRAAHHQAGLAKIRAAQEEPGPMALRMIDRRMFGQCSWPVGTPERPAEQLCCGGPIPANGFKATPTYCASHASIALAAVQPSKRPILEPAPRRRAA